MHRIITISYFHNNAPYNHHFLFRSFPSTALHCYLKQTLHSSTLPTSNSRVCLLDWRSFNSRFRSWSSDIRVCMYVCML